MTEIPQSAAHRRVRIELIDLLRAGALVAMAVYHFTWDLDFHGYVPRGMSTEGGWRLFARCIATSFLFLSGVSLVLAHVRGIQWRSFRFRETQLITGALLISVVTWFATPASFVFFGILHQIATASLIGLIFLRAPWFLTGLAGAAIIALPFFVSTPATNPRWLAWIGFAAHPPFTNDFVPVFPWTGVVLFGMAAAVLVERLHGWERIAALNGRLKPLSPVARLGRHTLIFYLLHQPILFGLVAGYAYLLPPDAMAQFNGSCRRECERQENAETCIAFCGCVRHKLETAGLMRQLFARETTIAQNDRVRAFALECSFPPEPSAP